MDEAGKIKLVNITGYTVLVLTGLVAASLAYRLTVRTYAEDEALRSSVRLTRKSLATGLGLLLTLGLGGAIWAKDGGLLLGASSLFGWHPLAMACATAVLSPAAIDAVTLRHHAKSASARVRLVGLHAGLQAAAAVALALGFAAIYLNKPPDKHFLSLHSWVGLAALACCAANLVYGALRSARRLPSPGPALLWRDEVHRRLGAAALLLLAAASALGLYNKVMVLPQGWGGPWAYPAAAWLRPGNTWAYFVLPGGGKGVYVALALLFWVAYFSLTSNAAGGGGGGNKRPKTE